MAVGNSRSDFWAPTSINSLPPELLTQIFYTILSETHTCVISWTPDKEISVVSPEHSQIDNLGLVCSYWRRVALTSPRLWAHIDLAICHPLGTNLLERAKVYAARARPLPFEIHIGDPGERCYPGSYDFAFLDSDKAPIRSLRLDLKLPGASFYKCHSEAIEYFLARCQCGVFTQYITEVKGFGRWFVGPFLQPEDGRNEHYGHQDRMIKLPNDHLEELWLPTRTLRMSGFFPHWSSRAYHGLVELRIGPGAPKIRATQLMEILKASPGLRIFHLKVPAFRNIGRVEPIRLEHLESLSVLVDPWGPKINYLTLSQVLGLLAPGSNPLRLGYFRPCYTRRKSLKWFAARSNIAVIYVEGWALFALIDPIRSCRHLQTLILNASVFENEDPGGLLTLDSSRDEVLTSETAKSRIETIYLTGFLKFRLETLTRAIERYSVQRLVICGGGLIYGEGPGMEFIPDTNKEMILAKLSTITSCSNVQYYEDNSPLPIDLNDWKLRD